MAHILLASSAFTTTDSLLGSWLCAFFDFMGWMKSKVNTNNPCVSVYVVFGERIFMLHFVNWCGNFCVHERTLRHKKSPLVVADIRLELGLIHTQLTTAGCFLGASGQQTGPEASIVCISYWASTSMTDSMLLDDRYTPGIIIYKRFDWHLPK